MRTCSLCAMLRIVPGTIDDYKSLARYHYLDGRTGPVAATFVLRPVSGLARALRDRPAGVIVYTLPTREMRLRSLAMRGLFSGFDRKTKLALINKNLRRISRVIIDPRFRGLGLASRLVRDTMPRLRVPIVEAVAAMGMVNPFFDKAGMTSLTAQVSVPSAELVEALSLVGIETHELIDPSTVQQKLDMLSASQAHFVERQVNRFLKGHSGRRNMPPGLQRTRYVLSRVAFTPIYYIWLNPDIPLDR